MALTPESTPTWRQDIQALAEFTRLVAPLLEGLDEPPIVTLSLKGGRRSRQITIYPWSEQFANEIRERLAGLEIPVVEGREPRSGQVVWPITEPDARERLTIPGIAQTLLFKRDLWNRLNNELNTAFDDSEEESISPETAHRIQGFVGRYLDRYSQDYPNEETVPQALSALSSYLAASATAGATLRAEF